MHGLGLYHTPVDPKASFRATKASEAAQLLHDGVLAIRNEMSPCWNKAIALWRPGKGCREHDLQ